MRGSALRVAGLAVCLAVFVLGPARLAGADYDTSVATTSVPPAKCGPGSRPETALQGEVPKADRDSGRSLLGYRCNLEQVGQYREGEGASWQFAWYGHCGYYGTFPGAARKTQPGVQVIDVSDPTHPVRTAVLDTPAMNSPHESLKVAPTRGLLAATNVGKPDFDIYDISGDCAKPRHLATIQVPGTQGHEGEFSPDGLTYWDSERSASDYCPIDVSDPTHPTVITCWPDPGTTHGLSLNDAGTRAYM
ncbi:MAG: LVIVD repeat-containing protein, partial [Candidatus Dormibacteria bacterium]